MPTETPEQTTGDQASTQDAIEVLLHGTPGAGAQAGDTATIVIELYERIERSYRAAAMAGRIAAQASSTTNFA